MNKQHDKASHEQHKHQHGAGKRPLHKDWRLWAAVVLMLVAMAVYVLTLDESLWPGGGNDEEPRVPAAP